MARPSKTGLDYFPMDVDMDDKFELIEAKHDLVGFGIVIKLFQKIYKSGYFIDWNEEKLLIFKKSINVDINKVTEVINDCLKYGIFDFLLFQKYNILTSKGIQKRFFTACERRKSLELIEDYIIVDIKSINVVITWVNEDNSTQRKEKESKEKENGREEETPPPPNYSIPNEIIPIQIRKCEAEMLADEITLLENARHFHLNPDLVEVREWLVEFFSTQRSRGLTEVTLKDSRKYFSDWLNKQLQNKKIDGKRNEGIGNQTDVIANSIAENVRRLAAKDLACQG